MSRQDERKPDPADMRDLGGLAPGRTAAVPGGNNVRQWRRRARPRRGGLT
jgi:hypothetical protein